MYPYQHFTPVKFTDPWGLYLKFRNEDEYEFFKQQAYAIYGTDELTFVYKNKKLMKIEGSGENASETGMALLNWLIESPVKFNINFNENSTLEGSSSSTSIDVGLSMEDSEGNLTRIPDSEVQSRLIHEATHVYSLRNGYDSEVRKNILDDVEGDIHNKALEGYKEAAAITVEEKFRQEMGYAPRDVSKYNGIGVHPNAYGTWPWQTTQKYSRKIFSESYGVSLMQSLYIWYDIQLNYMEGNFR